MSDYVLLVRPAVNRVYAEASVRLSTAELAVLGERVLAGRLTGIEETELGGVPAIGFRAEDLDARDTAYLANLSAVYVLFRRQGELLEPVRLHAWDQLDSDLLTIPKYQGKTNETFTKLLVNLTLFSSAFSSAFAGEAHPGRIRLLDPLCGRGTTLHQALTYGFDAAGMDLDTKDFEAYATFLQTWLKRKRLKHHAETTRIRREHRVLGRRFDAQIGTTRERYRAGERLTVSYVNVDAARALEFHKPGSFELVVADAPYGVQHGSRTAGGGPDRSPLDLLRALAPTWARLLRSGGACGLAWNTHVASRSDVLAVLAEAGLEPLDHGPYLELAHRVDQAVMRDVVVAQRP